MKARAKRRIKIRDALFRVRHYWKASGEIGIVYGFSIMGEDDAAREPVDKADYKLWSVRPLPKHRVYKRK